MSFASLTLPSLSFLPYPSDENVRLTIVVLSSRCASQATDEARAAAPTETAGARSEGYELGLEGNLVESVSGVSARV